MFSNVLVISILCVSLVLFISVHYYSNHFKPVRKSEKKGCLQLEFDGFNRLLRKRKRLFEKKYAVGTMIMYQEKIYQVKQIQEIRLTNKYVKRNQMKVYLKEITAN